MIRFMDRTQISAVTNRDDLWQEGEAKPFVRLEMFGECRLKAQSNMSPGSARALAKVLLNAADAVERSA